MYKTGVLENESADTKNSSRTSQELVTVGEKVGYRFNPFCLFSQNTVAKSIGLSVQSFLCMLLNTYFREDEGSLGPWSQGMTLVSNDGLTMVTKF